MKARVEKLGQADQRNFQTDHRMREQYKYLPKGQQQSDSRMYVGG